MVRAASLGLAALLAAGPALAQGAAPAVAAAATSEAPAANASAPAATVPPASPAPAAAPAAAPTPADLPHGVADYHAAAAGHYVMDPAHTAVVARVPHMGFSVSLFRFDRPEATLDWVPDDPAQSRLTASVELASISHPLAGFAEVLTGPDYLNAPAHPKATFTTTGFVADSPTQGSMTGDLQIMGKTHPATFQLTLVGAGRGFTGDDNGNPVITDLIGAHAETQIDPQAYGLNAFFTDPITIQIDAEFAVRPGK
ncbi:polyisoprenoid-binding protein [Paracoccus suum]|uniref:Polyisoprenoid-binding protein n=2 Tax=Paracoccus suum TaxID=2259340 RepID=A0A344PNS5_9RHOB|nr:polyisoprenoid-binding protein [Paracoccus suum]